MKTYRSNSINYENNKLQTIIIAIIFCVFIALINYNLIFTFLSIISIFFLTLYSIINDKKKYLEIYFEDDEVIIEYPNIQKTIKIKYTDLKKLTYINPRKSLNKYNSLKYIENGNIKKITFLSVAENEMYIDFLKWLNNKNSEIKFDAYPPDENMEYKIQENFGFKYRKFIKETL